MSEEIVAAASSESRVEVLHNENIGVLGHIDAGKTALSETKRNPHTQTTLTLAACERRQTFVASCVDSCV
jgi:DNA-binding sugar fermentation-stimulating protein